MKLKHTFKTDILFKLLFVKYPDLLKQLVAQLLNIPLESIQEFLVTNPEMPPESLGDKFCRLDINMTVNGQKVDLEVQVDNEGHYRERTLFYWAREYSTALPAGEDYSKLPRTIIISIINFIQFDCAEFHSEYQVLEVKRHTPLTDKLELVFFELPKLPEVVTAEDGLIMARFVQGGNGGRFSKDRSIGGSCYESSDKRISQRDSFHGVPRI